MESIDLDTTPAMAPPEGVTPDFEHPPNENALCAGVIGTALALCTIFVALRLYVNRASLRSPKTIWIGDGLLIIAYCLWVTCCSIAFHIIQSPGLYIHQWNLHLGPVLTMIRTGAMTVFIYETFIAIAKAVVLLEWIRIFDPVGSRDFTFWACQATLWFNVLGHLAMIIMEVETCVPANHLWDPLTPGYCRFNPSWTYVGSSSINLLVDLAILVIPQRVIWKLRMDTKKRLKVAAVFAVGVLGIGAAALRLYVVIVFFDSSDATMSFAQDWLCASAEAACTLLVACMPAMPKAFTTLKAQVMSIVAPSRAMRKHTPWQNTGELETIGGSGGKRSKRSNYTSVDDENDCVSSQTQSWYGSSHHADGFDIATKMEAGNTRSTRFEISEGHPFDGEHRHPSAGK